MDTSGTFIIVLDFQPLDIHSSYPVWFFKDQESLVYHYLKKSRYCSSTLTAYVKLPKGVNRLTHNLEFRNGGDKFIVLLSPTH